MLKDNSLLTLSTSGYPMVPEHVKFKRSYIGDKIELCNSKEVYYISDIHLEGFTLSNFVGSEKHLLNPKQAMSSDILQEMSRLCWHEGIIESTERTDKAAIAFQLLDTKASFQLLNFTAACVDRAIRYCAEQNHPLWKELQKSIADKVDTLCESLPGPTIIGSSVDQQVFPSHPTVFFGGDISCFFEVSKLFYSLFLRRCNELNIEPWTFVVLGNHEFWAFDSYEDCVSSYNDYFTDLGIFFMENNVCWLNDWGKHAQLKDDEWIKNTKMHSKASKRSKTDLPLEKKRHLLERDADYGSILLFGTSGFAGLNKEFNAESGIYRGTVSREDEIEQSAKAKKALQVCIDDATKRGCRIIVLSHNPIKDWTEINWRSIKGAFFSGHNHKNEAFHELNTDSHYYADNQVAHRKSARFKMAYVYQFTNPFAGWPDGRHEITSDQYYQFCSYIGSPIEGTGIIDHYIEKYGSRLYMILDAGYYGFFLVKANAVYILNGGQVRKIGTSFEHIHKYFSSMIAAWLKTLGPYRKAMEVLSDYVKSFGGDGHIHGAIVDVDFFNHAILDPTNGQITFYYSPGFGFIEEYKTLPALIAAHCPALSGVYKKQPDIDSALTTINFSTPSIPMHEVERSGNIYGFSRRMKAMDRLFENHVLRDWNDLLIQKMELPAPSFSL